jgi:hypothetical protein
MKKLELSESVSNLLMISSVSLAFIPFLLGDQLILIVNGFMNEASVMFDQFSTYLVRLLS